MAASIPAVVPSGRGLLFLHLGYLLQPRNGPERPGPMTTVSSYSSQEMSGGIGLGLGLRESRGGRAARSARPRFAHETVKTSLRRSIAAWEACDHCPPVDRDGGMDHHLLFPRFPFPILDPPLAFFQVDTISRPLRGCYARIPCWTLGSGRGKRKPGVLK